MSSELMVGSLTGGTPKLLLKDVSQAIFTQGHILYVRPGTQGEGTLMAQPFDLERLETSGDAFRLADNVASGSNGNSAFSASANGVLVFQASSLDRFSELVWIDRASGKQVGAPLGSPATYTDVRLSRDGSKAAVTIADNGQFNRNDIWIFDITRGGNPRKLTLDPADDFNPVWSPDGSEIIFTSDRKGRKLYRKASGGGPEDEIEFDDAVERASMDWSSTGTLLLATREASGPGFDLFTVPVPTRGTAAGKPAALVQSASNEVPGRYSWDGRWVAFVSNESGTPEVYVAPVSGPTGQSMKISANGGRNPVWRKDGKELYYCDNALRWIWAVEVNGDGNRFKADNPKQVAEVRMIGARQVFDATPQGERFLVSKARSNEPPPLTLVVNWLPSKR
jgi:dipeptidyl aminopeptidase/acylaminoacyl peptidase